METLLAGLAIFVGTHLIPSFPALRRGLVARLGLLGYKGVFALVSFAGFYLIVTGKAAAPHDDLWQPPTWAFHAAPALMLPAFILLTAYLIPSNLKRFTRHPMLWGVTLWGCAHLLANGDRGSVVLFGTFVAYSLVAMFLANLRGARLSEVRRPLWTDLLVVGGGIVGYGLMAFVLHPLLFGVTVIPH